MAYSAKSITAEAFRYMTDESPEWFTDLVEIYYITEYTGGCSIPAHWGSQSVNEGDWIVLTPDEQISVYSETVFNNLYELIVE